MKYETGKDTMGAKARMKSIKSYKGSASASNLLGKMSSHKAETDSKAKAMKVMAKGKALSNMKA